MTNTYRNKKSNQIYLWLSRCVFTRTYVQRVRKRYEIVLPGQEEQIIRNTMLTIVIGCMLSILEFGIICMFRPSIFQGVLAIVLAIILHNEVITTFIRVLELRILRQFEKFITDVRHYYYSSHMVDEAILDALDTVPPELHAHAEKFYEILTADTSEDLLEKYETTTYNSYFHLFLALCMTVYEYGDREIGDKSLFQLNLSNLKLEINLEILKLKQLSYIFSGLILVTVVPITLLKVIEHWALSNLPELVLFYHGFIGTVITIVIAAITMVVYFVIQELREYQIYQSREYVVIDELLSKSIVQRCLNHYMMKRRSKVNRLSYKIKNGNESFSIQQFLILKFLWFLSSFLCFLLIGITTSIQSNKLFHWYEFVCVILFAYLCSQIPDLKLYFHRKMREMSKEDEVVRFQSIVLMLMYIERMTVIEILERVEEFSKIYRKQLQTCINNYNYSEVQALEELKMSDSDYGFRRFVDQLLIADEIGIEKAFDEVATDRQYFQEKRKQENQINLEKRGALAKFIAYIPAVVVIGGYLILPFIMECYRQLNSYSKMMQSFMD